MEEKYIKFYKTFHKKYKNNENLILCSKSLSDSGISASSDLKGDNNGRINSNRKKNKPLVCIVFYF